MPKLSDYLRDDNEKSGVLKQCENVLENLHMSNLVHGDFRENNIISHCFWRSCIIIEVAKT